MPGIFTQRCLLPRATAADKFARQRNAESDLAQRSVAAGDAAICETGRRSLRRVLSVAAPGGVKLVGIVPTYFDKQAAQECVRRCGVPVIENAITVTEWAE